MYITSMAAPIPNASRDIYIRDAKVEASILKEHGAVRAVDAWGESVPEGKVTSFPMAVQLKEDESVLISWVEWPSKEASETGMQAFMQDPRTAKLEMPFDGGRLIWGGFEIVQDT